MKEKQDVAARRLLLRRSSEPHGRLRTEDGRALRGDLGGAVRRRPVHDDDLSAVWAQRLAKRFDGTLFVAGG
jgi:hypothetical protein